MNRLFYLSVVLLLFSCTSTERKTLKFTKENYNGKWPFSVSKIEVYCSGYSEIYCKVENGKTYALNGSAKGASHNNPSISKVEEIWLDDPDWQGLKISYGDFITQGLSLCENR